VRLDDIDRNAELAVVTEETLLATGLIRRNRGSAKLLANGRINRAVTVQGVGVSAGAREAILAAGGRVEE
jgi:large subunit ribosomal protein L15